MNTEYFECSECKKTLPRNKFHEFHNNLRKRPVTSKCRKCRKEDYYKSKYKTICICCQLHRPLNVNNQCKKCNEESGLRQCKKCNQILPLFLMFYDNSKVCKKCLKQLATT